MALLLLLLLFFFKIKNMLNDEALFGWVGDERFSGWILRHIWCLVGGIRGRKWILVKDLKSSIRSGSDSDSDSDLFIV